MTETLNVKPTPIQRNVNDVAIELTNTYISKFQTEAEELEVIYAKFYSLAKVLDYSQPSYLKSLVPEEIISKISR